MTLARLFQITAGAVLVSLLPAGAAPVHAQVPSVGDCESGQAEAFLDVGNVRAKILNDGGLFYNGGHNVDAHENRRGRHAGGGG